MTYWNAVSDSCCNVVFFMKVCSPYISKYKHFSDPAATSSSSSSPSSERLSMKKFVEILKGDEHVHESNRRMQRMLEEMLTKNMHLQTDLEQLSLEVVRLSKGADNNTCT
jgi:hypothetical protein